MVLTNRNTTGSLVDVVKLTTKSTHLDWKPKKAILAPTPSSVPTAKEITKPVLIHVHFGDINSIGSGT